MKLTKIGTDIIKVDENNYNDLHTEKIHIIKLAFKEPTKEKIYKIFENYNKTNRFIIDDNIRLYNYVLKYVNKKYYVSNTESDRIITFFKKNNKVVLDMFKLDDYEIDFMYTNGFLVDILANLEVIIVTKQYYNDMKDILVVWPGNVIISNGNDL